MGAGTASGISGGHWGISFGTGSVHAGNLPEDQAFSKVVPTLILISGNATKFTRGVQMRNWVASGVEHFSPDVATWAALGV
ncbi:hypothetical protein AADX86_12395, partial [Staphylococcus epidermidis]